MRLTDEAVERMARAIYCGLQFVTPWDEADGAIRRFYQRVARLAWEVTQVKATTDKPQGVTDEIVEAAARAMYERKRSLLEGIKPLPWDAIPRFAQDEWREIARAGLKAAGTVTAVHLCDTCARSMCRRRRDIERACEDSLFPARAVVVECGAYVADKHVEEVFGGDACGANQ